MKYLPIIRYVMLIVSVLIVVVYFSGDENNVDTLFYWTYTLLGLSIASAIILPTLNFAQNPQGALRSVIGVIIVVAVLGIAYGMSDATPVVTHSETYDNEFELRLSDTGLFTTYFAFAGAILSIVALEVYNMFK